MIGTRAMKDNQPLQREFRYLYSRYAGALFNHLKKLNVPESEAWDLLQETIIRFLAIDRSRREKIEYPFSYLLRILTRLAIRHLKGRNWHSVGNLEQDARNCHRPHEARIQAAEVLDKIWDKLDQKGRLVLGVMALEILSSTEISRLTGITRTTVRRRMEKINKIARKIRALEERT